MSFGLKLVFGAACEADAVPSLKGNTQLGYNSTSRPEPTGLKKIKSIKP